MTNTKLRIQQHPSEEMLSQQFTLIGTVDVDASGVLEKLYIVPSKASAELNFSQVDWVNSMGLAQLLKLFEHWQQKDINIRITSANQMVCLLFNKTGLAHLLADNHANTNSQPITKPEPPKPFPAPSNANAPALLAAESTVLQISPRPSADSLNQCFELVGMIDVSAVHLLEPLYVLPQNCEVELNFGRVDRVNSMGLAQLLKLFEHWQKQLITIRVTNVNRMITVLFKMTGLSRFLSETTTSTPAPVAERPKVQVHVAAPAPVQESPAASNTTAGLQIQPTPSAEALAQRFELIGIVDVDSVQALETMYVLPEHCAVELDFAGVQRVNSMGLAQLLKLFEHWQKLHITISIINTNRMIGVLFKMTGLTRFLSDAPAQNAPAVVSPTETKQPEVFKDYVPEPIIPLDEPKPSVATPIPQFEIPVHRPSVSLADRGKLNLWVSAQSSQQMNGWYFFNTYLQRNLGRDVQLELVHGAMGERRKSIEEMDIVFAKPFEATRLMLTNHYKPLLRPINQTDEVTLLVRADDPRQNLSEFQSGKIVTAASDSFVYLLGRFLLEEDESSLSDMEYIFSGHDIKALQMLLKGNADILFMLSETYRGLSGLTRKNLREIDQSETAFAFHLFSVAPHCAELGATLTEILLDMSLDSQGRQVLADLGIPGWVKPTQDECDMLVMLFNRYASSVKAA